MSIEILPGRLSDWENIAIPPDAPKPSSEFPFVLVEGNLGIPHKVLCSLYLRAVSTNLLRSNDARTVNAVSSVILLLNPAHQTALNTRKRLLHEGTLQHKQELIFTELLLRGSKDAAKESIIWDHRRWCFAQLYGSIQVPSNASDANLRHWGRNADTASYFPKLTPEAFTNEFDLVLHSCETYPRNYYGWAHWHQIMDICYASFLHARIDVDASETPRSFLAIILGQYGRLRRWIEQHISDYSAVNQLCGLQEMILHLISTRQVEPGSLSGDLSLSPLDHVLGLMETYPSHETIWLYLRQVVLTLDLDPNNVARKLQEKFRGDILKERLIKWSLTSSERPQSFLAVS